MKLLILYGTLTLNTEAVAQSIFEALAQNQNFEVELKSMIEITDPEELKEFDTFIVGCSTWSDGGHSPDGEDFMALITANPPILEGKKGAFFGLGETSYEHYCTAAIDTRDYFVKELKVEEVGEMMLIDGYPDDAVLESAKTWGEGIAKLLSS